MIKRDNISFAWVASQLIRCGKAFPCMETKECQTKPNKVPKKHETASPSSLYHARREPRTSLATMGKRKAKKRSNSTLKTTSYFKRFQVKFARRRAGEYHE